MQRKFTQLLRLLLIIFAFGITQNANAQIQHEDSPVEVYVGETVQVPIGSVYSSTLSRSTNVSYNWTCQGGLQIASGTRDYAYITGVTATTSGKLYFQCSYKYNGYFRTMNFYWDIVVKDNTVYVTKVEVTPSSATMIVGEKLKLTDNIYPTNATEQGVRWYSSAPNTVQVWESGLAEALSPGLATITCYAIDGSGEYATCDITVIPAEPTAVNITTEETSISVGETLKLGYAITPAGATTEVEWESDNTAVATVSDEGVITAIGIGEANITVTTANGLTDSYHITITAATSGGIPVNGKFEVDGIYYEVIDSVAKAVAVINKGSNSGDYTNEYSGTINIPERVTYLDVVYSVTSIADNAFEYNFDLTEITIPNSVTSIGSSAFKSCIGLTEITIPNSVTSIGNNAFSECSGLIGIIVAEGNNKYDSRDGCNAIIETPTNTLIIGCKNTIIPNSVTTIEELAFSSCYGLTVITIPNSVASIGNSAFENCSGLTSIIVAEDNKTYDSRDNCNAIIETSTNTLIVGCKNTIISNSVTSIGNNAFFGCDRLIEITIPNSVTSIGNNAFLNCSSLIEITIPNSVTSIGEGVFSGCDGLIEITIPNSVTTIGRSTFSSCYSLTKITIPNSVTSIGDYAFYFCTSLTEITIPNSVISIGYRTFWDCYGLTEITIPNSVTSIGERAFSGCSGLTEITSLNPTPPECGEYCFKDVPTTCVLKVPAGSKELYAEAEGWSQFTNIVKLSEDAGVEEITQGNDATEVARYDIHGRPLAKPTKGVNIVVFSDGTTRKEVVR